MTTPLLRRAASERILDVGGRQLRVAVRPGANGVSGRPPLLLINGIGASLELLEPFVRELDPGVDVIRFDPPGIGGSPGPAAPYRFTGLCSLIGQMLTELGYDRVDVLGISWGGSVAQHFAAFHRSRCRRLVLVATATGALMFPARPSVLVHMVTPRRHMDRGYLHRVAGDLYGGSARTAPEQVAALLHRGNWLGSTRGYLYQLTAGAGWTSVPFLPALRQRTLIVAGDDDPIIPLANARLMRALIPRSRLHIYHGGHLALMTEAAELAPVVDRFLALPGAALGERAQCHGDDLPGRAGGIHGQPGFTASTRPGFATATRGVSGSSFYCPAGHMNHMAHSASCPRGLAACPGAHLRGTSGLRGDSGTPGQPGIST